MPSLAGLFGRKSKSSSCKGVNSNTASELNDSSQSSPTAEYVSPDRSLPSNPNGRSTLHPDSARGDQPSSIYPSLATSPKKLRLPFSRKKVTATASTTSVATTSHGSNFSTPPRPAYMNSRGSTSAASDTDVDTRRLRPPPSKSAIFAAYGDPQSALSTRSLPTETSHREELAPVAPPVPPKKPSFFHWSKSTPSPPQTTLQKAKPKTNTLQLDSKPPPADINSFNLKSFRHVLPPSPNTSNTSLAPAIPRPRGTSSASQSSQRISVAAFREAHARRSTAGSPVPSNRAPSPHISGNYSSSDVRGGPSRPTQQSSHSAPIVPQNVQKKRSSGLAYTSDSDEDASSDEGDSDASVSPSRASGGIMRRKRTVTKRPDTEGHGPREPLKGRATKSEIGHGSSYNSPVSRRDFNPGPRLQSTHILTFQSPRQQNGNGQDDSGHATPAAESSRSHSSVGFNVGDTRPRASVSTSALSPSAAANRASVIATANANISNGRDHVRASSTYSNPAAPPPTTSNTPRPLSSSTSDSEDDDAPLATLLPPRRPGSAMSSASSPSRSNVSLHPPNIRSNTAPHKPLIDINELTHSRPKLPSKSHTNEGFTSGSTLLSGRALTASPTSMSHPTISPTKNTPIPTSTSPPTHFVSPPSSPTKERKEFISAPAPRLPPLKSSTGFLGAPSLSSASGNIAMRRETSPEEHKRDVLGDRLTRVLQMNASSRLSTGSSISGSASASGSRNSSAPAVGSGAGSSTTATPAPSKAIPKSTTPPKKLSPSDEDLATMLGAGISLISRTGEPESSESESESDDSEDGTDKEDTPTPALPSSAEPERIAPIPIKQRAAPPAFSVTSRPPFKSGNSNDPSTSARTSVVSTAPGLGPSARQRSSTLVPSSTSSVFETPANNKAVSTTTQTVLDGDRSNGGGGSGGSKGELIPRQRSSTMLPSTSSATITPVSKAPMPPRRPFVGGRRESPASSTGDSSSGRAPFTPKDGSEIGSTGGRSTGGPGARSAREEEWSGGVSGLPVKGKQIKRRSVSFEDDIRDLTKPSAPSGRALETHGEGEERRRERRRSEAKAAIELGNVINGRGPVVDDDDDDLPINQTLGGGGPRMSTLNPMMAMSGPMPMGFAPPSPGMSPGWNNMTMGMNMNMNPQMLSPGQFMPPAADPNFMAAHQQAMMFAKQAYQMAVAQQAMAAAGDEWERGSSVGGFGGGGSVYGGGLSSASVVGSPYGMGMGMGGMGMNIGMQSPGNGWSTGSVIFPGPPRSMYGGVSGARSDYGGGGGGGGGGQWSSSKSSYGESFGPSSNRYSKASASQGRPGYGQRDSGFYPPMPPIPQGNTGNNSPSGRATSTPRSRTASQPASPGRGLRKTGPPSSWKAGV